MQIEGLVFTNRTRQGEEFYKQQGTALRYCRFWQSDVATRAPVASM